MSSTTHTLMTAAVLATLPLSAAQHLLYVGTYTGPKSEGIYAFRYDDVSGKAIPLGLAAKSSNPSFLAIHPNGRFLYAVNETDQWQGKPGGSVTAFAIDAATGRLKELGQQSTMGGSPCHLSVDPNGRQLLVANYGGGSVVSLPIQPDGGLGPHNFFSKHTGGSVDPSRQKEPHAHSVNVSPDHRFAFVADLGTDRIHAYAFDPAKGITEARPGLDARLAPGSGPRHFSFSPEASHAYVINEMRCTVTAFRYEADTGKLTEVGTVPTVPAGTDMKGVSTAEVRVHPSGRFVFGSNRGHDSIAVFARDTTSGALTPVEVRKIGGQTPRNFNIDPSGRFLLAAGQNSHDIRSFQIDQTTGRLTPTEQRWEVGSPVCLRFVPLK
ncbi:MAG: 6-phosphogluconolactonase [Verrucomicrobiota bacterium]|jgi:6-phosphogluconolactonase